MTARRGSLRHKVRRPAREQIARAGRAARLSRSLRRLGHVLSAIVVGALVLFVGGTFGAQVYRIGMEDYRLHQQIVQTDARNADLQARSVDLRKQIVLLHDPDYLVPLIHEQLGLVKPHEVFIEIQPTAAPASN